MRRRPRALLSIAVIALLAAVPASAGAPPDQYEGFDGDATIIFDVQTGLKWQRNIAFTPETWATADIYCRNTFGGRLPTVKELLTLFDEEPHSEYDGALVTVHIDGDAFGYKTPVDTSYWTTTPAGATDVWTLDFKNGDMKEVARIDKGHYRCVK